MKKLVLLKLNDKITGSKVINKKEFSMINKIGKVTVYVKDQELAKDFWINKVGFVLKFEQAMGPNMSWIEVGPSEDEFTTLVLYSKSAMEQQSPFYSFQHN